MIYFETYCLICKRAWVLELPIDPSVFHMKWDLWGQGRLVQEVFTELTPLQHEALKTGTCAPCWKRVLR